MPVVVACLVPAAPLLLPRLTGDRVPETRAVRAAVAAATARLAGTDRLVVLAPHVAGSLAGFGGRPDAAGAGGGRRPDGAAAGDLPGGSWPHALAEELLAAVDGVPTDRTWCAWPDPAPARATDAREGAAAALAAPGRTGLLLLADGSRTRGARAPGGDDPRGAAVDAELAAALREQREADVPDARAVGATAAAAVALLARLARDGSPGGPTELLLDEAPLGVGYLVAVLGSGDRVRDRTAQGTGRDLAAAEHAPAPGRAS